MLRVAPTASKLMITLGKKGDNAIEFVNRASVNNRWLWWFNDGISQPNGITNNAEQKFC